MKYTKETINDLINLGFKLNGEDNKNINYFEVYKKENLYARLDVLNGTLDLVVRAKYDYVKLPISNFNEIILAIDLQRILK